MIAVDVRELLIHRVDEIYIEPTSFKTNCGELVNRVKEMLDISDDKHYALKQNEVFIHPNEQITDGERFIFSIVPDDNEED